jgi:hypothetical protein
VTSNLKGIGAAQKNNTYHRERRHPWTKEYRRNCIISDCDDPVYHDGEVYWTCCLHHLQQLQLGPFAPRISHDVEGWPLRCADTASQVAEALFHQGND